MHNGGRYIICNRSFIDYPIRTVKQRLATLVESPDGSVGSFHCHSVVTIASRHDAGRCGRGSDCQKALRLVPQSLILVAAGSDRAVEGFARASGALP